MKLETQTREDQQVKIIAEFESTELEKFKHQAARQLSQRAKIPGFRPGKAPYSVVIRMFGDDAVKDQAVEIMVDEVYPEVLKQADLKPSGMGKLDEILSIDPPKLSFIVPLPPEVILGNYNTFRKDFDLPPVTDADVDQALKRLQAGYATAEPVDRPAEKGDMVYIKISGNLVKPGEGEEVAVLRPSTHQVIIGDASLQEDNWPFPGFSKNLVGMAVNTEKVITHKFSADDENENLRGKKVEYPVSIQSIKILKLPDLNDEFAQTAGNVENVETLRNSIRSSLENNNRQEYEQKFYNELLDQIVQASTIKFPPHMLENEAAEVLKSVEEKLTRQQMDIETYLKVIKLDRDAFMEKEIMPAARSRLEKSLVIDEIGRVEKINLEEEELKAAFNETYAEVSATTDLSKVRGKVSTERIASAIAMEAASRLYNRRVLERLRAVVTGTAASETEIMEPAAPKSKRTRKEKLEAETTEPAVSGNEKPKRSRKPKPETE